PTRRSSDLHGVFVFVADIGSLESVVLGVDAQDKIDDVLEFDVGGVWSMPGTPAGVESDLVFGQVADGVVECFNADLGKFAVILNGWFRRNLIPVFGNRWVVDL